VLAVGRNQRALDDVCGEIQKAGGQAQPFVADVTTLDGPAGVVARRRARLGGSTRS
jgi:hypothetical protein